MQSSPVYSKGTKDKSPGCGRKRILMDANRFLRWSGCIVTSLVWLPVAQIMDLKIILLVYKSFDVLALKYVEDLL